MKKERDYRFCHRKGRAIQVMYKGRTRWISTGCDNMEDAIIFAEQHKNNDIQMGILLKDYARDFWTEKDSHQFRAVEQARGRNINPQNLKTKNSITQRFIIPAHGTTPLEKITPVMIERFIFSLDISASYKNMILVTYSQMLQRAKVEGYIQTNPAKDVKPIIQQRNSNIQVFTDEEIKLMFPDDDAQMVDIWGGITNALYFLLFRDTGWRPSEILGLNEKGYFPDKMAVYTTESVVQGKMKETIKTTGRGYDYKIGFISEQTKRMMDRAPMRDGYYFKTKFGFIFSQQMNHILRDVLDKLKIPPRTQYAFRHTFDSALYVNVPNEYRRTLMGHTIQDHNYLHLTAEQAIDRINKLR